MNDLPHESDFSSAMIWCGFRAEGPSHKSLGPKAWVLGVIDVRALKA
jgi:hypothetical protein